MRTNKITAELFLNDGTKIVLDKTKMKSIQSLSQSTADASTIYYGCLPSTGNLEIIDTNGTIKGYIEDGLIDTSNLEINIYINDNIVRHHISTDSEYVEEDNSFQITLGDMLDLWDEINFSGYYYPEHSETAYDMFYNIFTKYGYSQSDIDTMLSDIIINEKLEKISIKDYLRYINIEYPYLPKSTFREMVDKFCTLAQLDCFLNIDGKPKFISSRPITSAYTNPIIIPKKSMYNSFSKSVLLKNKYDDVNLETQIVSDELNINSSVATNTIKQFNKTMTTCNVDYITVDFYSGSARTEHVVARIEGIYTSGEFSIPKKSNYNLDIIKKTYNYNKNNEQSTWSISYEETSEDDFRFFMSRYFNSFINEENPFSIPIIGSLKNSNGKIDVFSVEQKSENDSSKSAIAELQDNNSITITERENDYLVNYNILTNVKTFSGRGFSQKEGIETGDIFYGSAKEYDALKLDINIHGDKRTISFSSDSVENQSSKNIVTINSNELIQENSTIIFSSNISDIIKSNILLDYSNGISNGNIEIAYTDYYYEDGNIAISTENGDLISIGDTVKIEGDDNLWKVTSVNFEKQGYPKYSELGVIKCLQLVVEYSPIDIEGYNSSYIYLAYNNGNYIASDGNIIIKSTDLIEWEDIRPAEIGSWAITGIKYANDKLFLLRNNGAPLYSEDNGSNWNEDATIQDNITSHDIAFGNGIYVIVGNMNGSNHNLAYSSDLISWTTARSAIFEYNQSLGLNKIAFGNNIFVAVATGLSNPCVFYSLDGINWSLSYIEDIEKYHVSWGLAFGNNRFVIATEAGMFYSDNGISWSKSISFDNIEFNNPYGLNFVNNKFVFYNNDYFYESIDGMIWNKTKIYNEYVAPNSTSYIYYDGNDYIYPVPVSSYGFIGRFTISLK